MLSKKFSTYRLSHARRTVENAFGILASRFHVFLWPLMIQPHNSVMVIKGAVVLYNFLRTEKEMQYTTHLSIWKTATATFSLENGDKVLKSRISFYLFNKLEEVVIKQVNLEMYFVNTSPLKSVLYHGKML